MMYWVKPCFLHMERLVQKQTEIQDLLASDNISNAINRLLDFIRDFANQHEFLTEGILISSNYKKYVREERQNLIDNNSAQRQRSQIISHILGVLKDVAGYVDSIINPKTEAVQELISDTKKSSGTIQYGKEQKTVNVKSIDEEYRYLKGLNNSVQQQKEQETVLSITDFIVRYSRSDFKLGKITLDLQKNEILGVVGENGNGKTTLFDAISGEHKHTSGSISFPYFLGYNGKLDWLKIKSEIAYVKQELPKWHGKLIDNLSYEAAKHNILGKDNTREVQYIVHRLGLTEYIDKKWNQISGGFKLRFAIAKAMIKKPKLIILDEPLANLDINTQTLLLRDLRDLSNCLRYPVSIILSSQHINEVEFISDKVLFLKGVVHNSMAKNQN